MVSHPKKSVTAKRSLQKPTTACLVDGEHYLANIRESLVEVRKTYSVKYLIFIGGTEKIGTPADVENELPYKVYFAVKHYRPDGTEIGKILKKHPVDVVLDLSDAPIMDYLTRFEVVCRVLFEGVTYRGSDFEFQPLRFKKLTNKPSVGIWGTGKRIGKTAMGGLVGRVLKEMKMKPAIVTLSRGGPTKPIVVRGDEMKLDLDYLLNIDAHGIHASSDCFQDALSAGVPTFGCRRCGGGMAGRPVVTVVDAGVRMAQKASYVKSVIVEGSGASVAEIQTDKVILMMDILQPAEILEGYMTPLRILYADLVVLNMCEDFLVDQQKIDRVIRRIREVKPKVRIATAVIRPFLREPKKVKGKKIFLVTTAPKEVMPFLAKYLEKKYGCKVVGMSYNLSIRPELIQDLKALKKSKADFVVTELKAAAIAVAVKEAKKAGLPTALLDYETVALPKGGDVKDLKKEVRRMFGTLVR
jgi:cyclic 2,3-diphosphoglycerate synthetase